MSAADPLLASAWVRIRAGAVMLRQICTISSPADQNYPLAHEDGEGLKQQRAAGPDGCSPSAGRQDGMSWQSSQGSAAASVCAPLASVVSPFYEPPAPPQAASYSCPLP